MLKFSTNNAQGVELTSLVCISRYLLVNLDALGAIFVFNSLSSRLQHVVITFFTAYLYYVLNCYLREIHSSIDYVIKLNLLIGPFPCTPRVLEKPSFVYVTGSLKIPFVCLSANDKNSILEKLISIRKRMHR